jgi:glutaredoxin-related protein
MNRFILPENRVAPSALSAMSEYHRATVDQVAAALGAHRIVVVGMAQNPFVKKVRRLLDAQGIAFHYLEYGSYFSLWKPRLAIKLWSGWPTFPQVFVDGVLIGGYKETNALVQTGRLTQA